MTITVVNAGLSNDNSASGATTNLSVTLTSAQSLGDLIVLITDYDNTLSIISGGSVTDTAGNTYSQATTATDTVDYNQDIWYCLSAKASSASANAVKVTVSGTNSAGNFSVRVWTANTTVGTWSLDKHSTNFAASGASTVTPGAVTTTSLNELLVTGTGVGHTVTGGPAGWVNSTNDGLGDRGASLIATTIQTAINPAFTVNTAGSFVCSQATFAATSGPPATDIVMYSTNE